MEIYTNFTKLNPSPDSLTISITKEALYLYIDKRRVYSSIDELKKDLEPIIINLVTAQLRTFLKENEFRLDVDSIKILNLRQILIECSDFVKGARYNCCKEYSLNTDFTYCPKCGKIL